MSKWFKRYRLVYLPVSWQGCLLTIVTIAFNIQAFVVVDRSVHSVSDLFYGIFPYFVGSVVVLFWIAANTSKPEK